MVSPLGTSLALSWSALQRMESGIKRIEPVGATYSQKIWDSLPSQVAGIVPEHDDLKPRTDSSRFISLALMAAKEAIGNSNLLAENNTNDGDCDENGDGENNTLLDLRECGVAIGTGIGSLNDIVNGSQTVNDRGLRRLSPHFVPNVLCNSAAGHVSEKFGFKGPNHCVSTACATGAHAIGDAFRFIKYGDANVMLCGGSESSLDPLSIGGFSRLRALSTNFNDEPEKASRPFDAGRDGFVIAEGACVLVLEELNHALDRGADILCEVRGYGMSGDGYHKTAPEPTGDGAVRAMNKAAKEAGIQPFEIDYVNAHATSTPLGDGIEVQALSRFFAPRAGENFMLNRRGRGSVLVGSTKGHTGHLLGAAGALECAFAIMSLKDNIVVPTMNLENISVESSCDMSNIILLGGQDCVEKDIKCVMSNSFGFGGTNASLVFSEYS